MGRQGTYSRLQFHVEFAEAAIDRHKWPGQMETEMRSELAKLRSRLRDNCVNISVVGEFSVGKSSFINALLGMDLLDVDDMPDTTLAPTVISYWPRPLFQVVYTSGTGPLEELSIQELRGRLQQFGYPELPQPEDFPSMDAYIEKYNEVRRKTDAIAAGIRQFNIGIPSEFLKNGFRLVDTPGLASFNARCEQVARDVMMCTDASIIVGDAVHAGLMQNTRDMLAGFLGVKLKYCMTVITRFDLINPARREEVKKFIAASTRSYFNLTAEQMPVYMVVPPTIIAAKEGRQFGSEHNEMLALTRKSMDDLAATAVQRREQVIAASLYTIFDGIFRQMEKHIEDLRLRCQVKLDRLSKSRSVPLQPFIERSRNYFESKLTAIGQVKKDVLEKKLDDLSSEIFERCRKKVLVEPVTAQQMSSYLRTKFGQFVSGQVCMFGNAADETCAEYGEAVAHALKDFEDDLRREFDRLKIIPVVFDMERKIEKVSMSSLTDKVKVLTGIAEARVNSDNKAIGLSVLGGVLGSIVAPGLGTGIGVALGAFLGSGGKTGGIQGAREQVGKEFEPRMRAFLEEAKQDVFRQVAANMHVIMTDFLTHISRYQTRYQAAIDEQIRKENHEQASIRCQLSQLGKEINEIYQHKKELKEICKTI